MSLRWFVSQTARQAKDMRKHVAKMFAAQRDILSPQAVEGMSAALQGMDQAGGEEALKQQMDNLEKAANKWLKPYPNAGIRENVEVLLVALAVAMAIRTFFAQPFKIPTGSMQPTLFGVTPGVQRPGSSANQVDMKMPGVLQRMWEFWTLGNSYFNIVAPENGQLQTVGAPTKLLLFNLLQHYQFNGKSYSVWFPADDLFQRAGFRIYNGAVYDSPDFKSGDMMVRMKINAGDHLFVDRISYNFRHPKRGEIIVFETRGIPTLPQDQFYIKRLVALGGEHVQLGIDRHLIIDGKRLDATTPHFENVYSFDPSMPPSESHYSGHVPGVFEGIDLSPKFADSPDGVYTIRTNHYMVMGDNTVNSYDSRAWGDFSRTNVIGKYLFVYWPFSKRFGWGVR